MQLKALLITAALSSLALAAPEPQPTNSSPPSKGQKPALDKGALVELTKDCKVHLDKVSGCTATTEKGLGKPEKGKCVQNDRVGYANFQDELLKACDGAKVTLVYNEPERDSGQISLHNGYDDAYRVHLDTLKPGTKMEYDGKDWKKK